MDGAGIDSLLKSSVFGLLFKKGYELHGDTELFSPVNKTSVKDAKELVKYYKGEFQKEKQKRLQKIL